MQARGPTVLVVDDDKGIRETLELLLHLEGFQSHCAANGKEAIELLESGLQPSVIILDLMMPTMNGWQFLERRTQTLSLSNIPVIIITAGNEGIPFEQVDAVIRKPMKVEELLAAICSVLRR